MLFVLQVLFLLRTEPDFFGAMFYSTLTLYCFLLQVEMEHNVDGVGQNASRNHVVEMEVHNFHLLLEKVNSTKEEFSALRGEIHAYVEDFRVRQMEILEALAEIREMVKVLLVRNADRRDDPFPTEPAAARMSATMSRPSRRSKDHRRADPPPFVISSLSHFSYHP